MGSIFIFIFVSKKIGTSTAPPSHRSSASQQCCSSKQWPFHNMGHGPFPVSFNAQRVGWVMFLLLSTAPLLQGFAIAWLVVKVDNDDDSKEAKWTTTKTKPLFPFPFLLRHQHQAGVKAILTALGVYRQRESISKVYFVNPLKKRIPDFTLVHVISAQRSAGDPFLFPFNRSSSWWFSII